MNRERFKGAPWFEEIQDKFATIVGQGGIGSWLYLFAARAGFQYIMIVDNDTIEDHNMGGQFFSNNQIGLPKVTAAIDNKNLFAPQSRAIVHQDLYDPTQSYNEVDVLFSAVDNMEARKQMFETFKSTDRLKVFVDGRLEPEHFTVFFVTKDNVDRYAKTLVDDSEIPDLDCTFKQTSHVAAMCAGTMLNIYTNYLAEVETPFKVEWYLPAMHIEIED